MDAQPKNREGKIVRAQVVPWEGGRLYAVAYEFEKRFRGAFQVGSEDLAQEIAQELIGKDEAYLEREQRRAHVRLKGD
jgi:hypothetical protein